MEFHRFWRSNIVFGALKQKTNCCQLIAYYLLGSIYTKHAFYLLGQRLSARFLSSHDRHNLCTYMQSCTSNAARQRVTSDFWRTWMTQTYVPIRQVSSTARQCVVSDFCAHMTDTTYVPIRQVSSTARQRAVSDFCAHMTDTTNVPTRTYVRQVPHVIALLFWTARTR
jgi:hypothetical protein